MTTTYSPEFLKALEQVINCASAENASNTPDFVLAQYLVDCLHALDSAIQRREAWYGRQVGGRYETKIGL